MEVLLRTLVKITRGSIQGKSSVPSTASGSHPPSIADGQQVRKSGRGVRRLVTLCGTITQLVAEYDNRLLASESDAGGDDDDDDGDGDHPPERKEEIRR